VSDPQSYLEQCITALPPEKREAARRAFEEISETGDDSYLSKLLAVLEANNAYARKIPKDLADAGGKLMREMAGIADKLAAHQSENEDRHEASLKKLLAEQRPQWEKSVALDNVAAAIEKQRMLLEQLKRSSAQPKEESGAGILVLAMIAGLTGAILTVWFFWDDYQAARQAKSFVDRAVGAGIRQRVDKTETGNRLTIVGPAVKGANYQKATDGVINGMVIDFAEPK
jgi:hypothetical protein